MITTILGLIAAAGFVLYAVPQMLAVYRTPRLHGFSLWGWTALSAALTAILIQLVLAGVWIMAGAQVVATVAAYYTLWAIWRKS